MSDEDITGDQVASSVSDWMSSLLAVPLIRPKTTVAAVAGLIAAYSGTMLWSSYERRSPPPTPSDQVLQIMMKEVEERSAAVRAKLGVDAVDAEQKGVFETMRDAKLEGSQ